MTQLAWYGDDFTGSTDVLEVLALHGIDAVLYLSIPTASTTARFAHCAAVGLAGESRSQTPEWMNANLPRVFAWLASTGAAMCHYKVCSTFDSAPEVGSIGRALELGRAAFNIDVVPMVVGAPALKRFMVFGNLFAAVDGVAYRIDRHPTMSRHPITPMREADLRLHLAKQTALSIGLLDTLHLTPESLKNLLGTKPGAYFIDVHDDASLRAVGALLWNEEFRSRFVLGSSGIEYALVAHWGNTKREVPGPAPVKQLVAVSGSCSPVTAAQIAHARANGFICLRVIDGIETEAIAAINNGASVVLYSSEGAADIANMPGNAIAERNGSVLRAILDATNVRRVVVAGGDTSSHVGRQLGIDALTFLNPIAPGAPLCRAHAADPRRDGIEIVFKGGQCGAPDFFFKARGY